jgi:hypothetical protein
MTQTTVATTLSSEPEQPDRRRRWPWAVGLVVAMILLPCLAFGVLFLVREDPGAKSIDEAVGTYRQGASPTTDASDVHRPIAGVYSATGTGDEALSFPPLGQNDGTIMPLTVQYEADGCWVIRVDYNEAHWQTWRDCPGGSAAIVLESGGQTYQRWDLGATQIENTSTFDCAPPAIVMMPDPSPGASWTDTCTGTNTQTAGETTSAGPYTFVGAEDVVVAGAPVATHHYRQSRTLAGAQTGEQVADLWFVVPTGLPVRSERSIHIESNSPVGAITYTETGTWQLTSLEPAT